LDSPHRSIRPSRVIRSAVQAGLAVALCCGASGSAAQSRADSTGAAMTAAGSATSSNWSDRLRGVVQARLAPIYDSFADLLGPAAGKLTWGGNVHFESAVPGEDRGLGPFRAFVMGESSSTGVSEDAFSPLLLNPRRFRVPWALAPGNMFHAMPVMPLAAIGPVHVDFVAASLGINSGTSAAFLQLSARF
jgi:hypothetical protein